MIFLNIIKNIAIFLGNSLYKVNYHNTQKIPNNKGYIICCNHRSNWDPVFIYKPMKTKLYFMAKQELFKFGFFGHILKKLGAIPVKRGSKDMSAINQTIDLVNQKKVVVIFPEGTRSKTGEFLKPKSGAVMIANKTNSDILPVRIIYQNPKKLRSKVDVIYGDVITPNQLNISEHSLKDIKNASLFVMNEIKKLSVK